jgi:ketosteroid isomerase-like protein
MRINYKYLRIIFTIFTVFLLFSCNNNSKKNQADSEQNQSTDFKELVQDWNDAHNNKDFDKFIELYNADVNFYQTNLTAEECKEKKESLLNKSKDFEQTIKDLEIVEINKNEYKCSFIKTSTINGDSFDYPSYLIFTKSKTGWKISAESDLITDENIEKMYLSKRGISGDYNSDGALEYMWLIKPKFPDNQNENSYGECVGDCNCTIEFSNKKIPPIELEMCIGGYPVNEGDLNDDGSDEIGILPDWWTSYWKAYFVYTLKNGKWEYLVEPISTYYNQWQEGVDVINKTPNKEGYVTINYSEMDEVDIVTKSMEVKVN